MFGQIAIVGCGLIGGSLLKALRARQVCRAVVAIDHERVLGDAMPLLDAGAPPGSLSATRLLEEADLVILATPVDAIVASIAPTLDCLRDQGIVTDTGS